MQNLFFIIILSIGLIPLEEPNYKPIVVLELFTSQGCSSCPSADRLLTEVSESYGSENVIALSYHVDYWNYIGWKDPFSKKAYSDKQRKYSRKFFSSSIYTPQVVINGKEHFVGSKRHIMDSKLKSYSNKKAENLVAISNVKKAKDVVQLNYKIEGDIATKQLRLALVIKERITKINRGENKNKVLKNSNIVVNEVYVDLKSSSKQVKISIPDIVKETDELSIVALIQDSDLSITGGIQQSL